MYTLRGQNVAYDNIAAGSVAGRENVAAGGDPGELTATFYGGGSEISAAAWVSQPTTDTPYENPTVAADPPNPERLTP